MDNDPLSYFLSPLQSTFDDSKILYTEEYYATTGKAHSIKSVNYFKITKAVVLKIERRNIQ